MRNILIGVLLLVTLGVQLLWDGQGIHSLLTNLTSTQTTTTTTTINIGDDYHSSSSNSSGGGGSSGKGRLHQQGPPLIPKRLIQKFRNETKLARRYLLEGSPNECEPQRKSGDTCVFRDVTISLPIRPPLLKVVKEKTMINPAIAYPDGNCTVYAMGIEDKSEFEQYMTKYCKEVHAFDCTVELDAPAVTGHGFTFHQTCIGSPTDIDEVAKYGHNNRTLEFKSLTRVMKELGHEHIDILKFDIEGSEHELFEKEIFTRVKAGVSVPGQLLFELHTEGANPDYVPPTTVKGIDRSAVNNLMLRLHDIGYRIIGKVINRGDGNCADFGMALAQ